MEFLLLIILICNIAAVICAFLAMEAANSTIQHYKLENLQLKDKLNERKNTKIVMCYNIERK